jgi:hypothetical protein
MKTFKQYTLGENKNIEEKFSDILAAGLIGGATMLSPLAQAEQPQDTKTQVQPSVNLSDLIKLIVQHEGLVRGQTPFKITSPEIGKWTTIHGFKIDRNAKKPSDRKNFIFLKNPDEVPKAVEKQFVKYATNPSKYGLPSNVTLKGAISKFDQTGANDKIAFIKKQMPTLNVNQPLIDLL